MKCNKWGHRTDECWSKSKVNQVWKPKAVQASAKELPKEAGTPVSRASIKQDEVITKNGWITVKGMSSFFL